MTSPIDWPPPVLPGQTITDTWGNQVVAGIRMVPAHVRGRKSEILTTVDTPIDLTGAVGLIDPTNRLGNTGVNVHTAWAGVWSVHATYLWRSYLGSEAQGCRLWFQIGATRYAQATDRYNTLGATTSAILVVPSGGVIEVRYQGIDAGGGNAGAVLDIDFGFCWIGPA
jgi:hypothetical protein